MLAELANIKIVKASTAKDNLPDLVSEVERHGQEFVLTRYGTPVARLIPADTPPSPQTMHRWAASLKELHASILK